MQEESGIVDGYTNLAEELEYMADGEHIEKVVLYRAGLAISCDPSKDYGMDRYKGYADIPFGEPLTWEEALPHIQSKFYTGYGTQECPGVAAWTRNKVLYLHEYDGSTCIRSVPRNPPRK